MRLVLNKQLDLLATLAAGPPVLAVLFFYISFELGPTSREGFKFLLFACGCVALAVLMHFFKRWTRDWLPW
jgi:hypothetical protein